MLPYFKNCKICGALRAHYILTFIVQQRLFAFVNQLPCIQMCCRPNHNHFNFKIKSQTQWGIWVSGWWWVGATFFNLVLGAKITKSPRPPGVRPPGYASGQGPRLTRIEEDCGDQGAHHAV